MNSQFPLVFARLREILEPYAGRLKVTADAPGHYCLEIPYSPKFKKGFPVAWVKTGKGYVSFHFMPVYMFPKLRAGMSDLLSARMQGKSCFNFTKVDEVLFHELEGCTREGLKMCRESGVWD